MRKDKRKKRVWELWILCIILYQHFYSFSVFFSGCRWQYHQISLTGRGMRLHLKLFTRYQEVNWRSEIWDGAVPWLELALNTEPITKRSQGAAKHTATATIHWQLTILRLTTTITQLRCLQPHPVHTLNLSHVLLDLLVGVMVRSVAQCDECKVRAVSVVSSWAGLRVQQTHSSLPSTQPPQHSAGGTPHSTTCTTTTTTTHSLNIRPRKHSHASNTIQLEKRG